ncbi:MAG TPA: metallophosphoesterase [Tissierellia bacterium]|nr:metallophosphoesterase [Tissierellia bacterium]
MKIEYIFFLMLIAIFLTWQNNGLVTTNYSYKSEKVPDKFDGFKILHISDFHNKNFYGSLTNRMKEINPDIIVISGDLIDRRKTNLYTTTKFIQEIVKVAPVYYVSGNHEQLSEHYAKLKVILNNFNVINMDDFYTKLYRDGSSIGLIGIADPAINADKKTYLYTSNNTYARNILNHLTKDLKTEFNILLSHRPELLSVYKEFNIDLVFSGHAHGGQIRIPFIGGILSPNQGFFPKLSEGMHKEGSTSIVVSRGLGNSLFPFRILNRPELIVVTLNKLF